MATPKKTPSRAELTGQKVAFVRGMLGEMATADEIKSAFAKKFGGSTRSAEPWILSACVTIRDETSRSTEEHRATAYEAYRKIIASPKTLPRDRLKALERLDKILGLEAEIKISTNGSTNLTVTSALSPADERKLIDDILNGDDETDEGGDANALVPS